MKVEEGGRREEQQFRAFFGLSLFPGLVGGELGGATAGFIVVPGDLSFEELVSREIIGDFFVGQQGDQAFLKALESAFDFAFGGGVGGDAMVDAQGGEGALELGVGVESVGGGTMSKERKTVGIETGWQAIFFEEGAQMDEVTPSGVAGHEGAAQDFA